jgi:polyamine oxidase
MIAPISSTNVVLGCFVTSIDYSLSAASLSSSSSVTVACADGRTFPADQVIVAAVPLTVLQAGSITFNPPLPQAKLDAMATDVVAVPPGAKLFLKFHQDFYHNTFQVEPTDNGERFFYNAALNQDTDDFILGVLALGDQAPTTTLTTATNSVVAATQSPPIVSCRINLQDWTAEPFVRGTYSHYKESGQCDDVMETLRAPIGDNCIFFAGEHLSIDYEWGYVHGAALSGRAAARAVLNSGSGRGGDGRPGGLVGLVRAILSICFA